MYKYWSTLWKGHHCQKNSHKLTADDLNVYVDKEAQVIDIMNPLQPFPDFSESEPQPLDRLIRDEYLLFYDWINDYNPLLPLPPHSFYPPGTLLEQSPARTASVITGHPGIGV